MHVYTLNNNLLAFHVGGAVWEMQTYENTVQTAVKCHTQHSNCAPIWEFHMASLLNDYLLLCYLCNQVITNIFYILNVGNLIDTPK
jgi:hypothetical protein